MKINNLCGSVRVPPPARVIDDDQAMIIHSQFIYQAHVQAVTGAGLQVHDDGIGADWNIGDTEFRSLNTIPARRVRWRKKCNLYSSPPQFPRQYQFTHDMAHAMRLV